MLDEFEVESKTYPAPGNDLVVMHLRNEEEFLAVMRAKHDLEIDEVEFVEDTTDVTHEEVLYTHTKYHLLTLLLMSECLHDRK